MSGIRTPPSAGHYGRVVLAEQEPLRVVPSDLSTGSVLVKAFAGDDSGQSANQGVVYIGFDDEVSDENGMPLEPGEGVGFDIQNESQGIWAYPEVPGDQVRVITTN